MQADGLQTYFLNVMLPPGNTGKPEVQAEAMQCACLPASLSSLP